MQGHRRGSPGQIGQGAPIITMDMGGRLGTVRTGGLGSRDVLPGMNAGASLSAVPSPIEGSGTAWVLLGSWALSPARPTPIPPRHECRGFSALLVTVKLDDPTLIPDLQAAGVQFQGRIESHW